MAVKKKTKKKTSTKHRPVQKSRVVRVNNRILRPGISKPRTSLSNYLLKFFGAKKIGKTTLAAQFPGFFFLPTEPGTKSLKIWQPLDEDGYGEVIKTWTQLQDYVGYMLGRAECKGFVFDIIDKAFVLAFKHTCKRLNIEHPHKANDFGFSWGEIRAEFSGLISDISTSGKGIIFLSHDKIVPVEKWDGTIVDKVVSTLTGQAYEEITAIVDLWAFYNYIGNKRVLYIRGNEYVDAGCRIKDRFMTKNGEPVQSVPMGSSPEEAYRNLLRGFNNELTRPGLAAIDVKEKDQRKAQSKAARKSGSRSR